MYIAFVLNCLEAAAAVGPAVDLEGHALASHHIAAAGTLPLHDVHLRLAAGGTGLRALQVELDDLGVQLWDDAL